MFVGRAAYLFLSPSLWMHPVDKCFTTSDNPPPAFCRGVLSFIAVIIDHTVGDFTPSSNAASMVQAIW